MDTANMTQAMQIDSQELRNEVFRAMKEAGLGLSGGKVPPWLESSADFIKLHPWISLGIVLLVIFLISAIIREILCSYFKINEILKRVKRLEEKMK
jgi:hypothetical protein